MKIRNFIVHIFTVNLLIISVATAQTDIENLENYSNSDIGFKLKHPNSWILSHESESVSARRFIKAQNRVAFITFILQKMENENNLSISNWYSVELNKLLQKGVKPPEMSISMKSVGGLTTIIREHTNSFGKNYTYYIALNKSDIFTISFHYDKEIEKEIALIISTIEFINE